MTYYVAGIAAGIAVGSFVLGMVAARWFFRSEWVPADITLTVDCPMGHDAGDDDPTETPETALRRYEDPDTP